MAIPSFYKEEQESRRVQEITRYIVDVAAVLCLAAMAVIFLFDRVTVTGRAMEPILKNGEEVLVDKVSYTLRDPERLDIIYCEKTDSSGNERRMIRRIIGLPGERVQIVNGKLKINGQDIPLKDNLDRAVLAGIAEQEMILDADEYFVLGDNRDNSEDSRFESIGNIKLAQIEGKVWLRILPFSEFGLIRP